MYKVGEIFGINDEYTERAMFCNENHLCIEEITKDTDTERKFQIQELPKKTDDEILEDLRLRREVECFPIINRGKLWYDNLTTEQVTELDEWYNAWLDVTETKVIPNKPNWLV